MASSSSEEENYWPGYVDALTTMTMVLTFILMVLGVTVFTLSQNVSRSYLATVADAVQVDPSAQRGSTEELRDRILQALAQATQERDELRRQLANPPVPQPGELRPDYQLGPPRTATEVVASPVSPERAPVIPEHRQGSETPLVPGPNPAVSSPRRPNVEPKDIAEAATLVPPSVSAPARGGSQVDPGTRSGLPLTAPLTSDPRHENTARTPADAVFNPPTLEPPGEARSKLAEVVQPREVPASGGSAALSGALEGVRAPTAAADAAQHGPSATTADPTVAQRVHGAGGQAAPAGEPAATAPRLPEAQAGPAVAEASAKSISASSDGESPQAAQHAGKGEALARVQETGAKPAAGEKRASMARNAAAQQPAAGPASAERPAAGSTSQAAQASEAPSVDASAVPSPDRVGNKDAAQPSTAEPTTIVQNAESARLASAQAGAKATVDPTLLKLVFSPRATHLDAEALAAIEKFVKASDAVKSGGELLLQGFADLGKNGLSEDRRVAFYRVLVIRQALMDRGIPANRLSPRVELAETPDQSNTVEVRLKSR